MKPFERAAKDIKEAHEVVQRKQKRFLQRRKTRRDHRHQKGTPGFLLHRNGLDIESLTSAKTENYSASKKGIGVVVHSFGKFKTGPPCHTRHYFLCQGFRSHVVNKSTSPWTDIFQSEVLDGGEAGPLFRVTDLRPGTKNPPVTRRSPGRAWWDMLNNINTEAATQAKSTPSHKKCPSNMAKETAGRRRGWDGAKRVRVRLRVNGRTKAPRTTVLLSFRPYFCREEPDIRNLRGSEVGVYMAIACKRIPWVELSHNTVEHARPPT